MLKLKNVYKIYENGTVAVRNASLEFPNNGMVAIIGSSGCGKSTLLNLLSNNDIPSKGERLYKDKAYREYDKEVLLKDFAIVYQDFKLIENLTVYQNIKIGYELAINNIDVEYILQVADKLGIRDILDEKVYSLSGGQQQRVAIARAVVRRPKVIFADEPTGNLDSTNSENVYKILKELSKEILVVIVSHDKAISKFADRIIEMDNGRVVNDYAREEYSQIHKEYTMQEEVEPKTEVLNTDIYYSKKKITEKPKNSKKTTKISSKNIFSYTKDKSKNRKKQGLSLNSTLGLTIAFNNKGIGKKVVLSCISILMIALILFSVAIIFSTPEKTFYLNMKKNEAPFVCYSVAGRDYNMSETELKKLNSYVEQKCGANVFVKGSKHYLHHYLDYIKPFQKESVPKYFADATLGRFEAIFVDDPKEIGLQMLIGRAPQTNNLGQDEIAISKTYYDYLNVVGKFVNVDGEIVDFSKHDLIGSYIEEFRFTITGVFEDYNEYDLKAPVTEEGMLRDIEYENFLIKTIIRPSIAQEEMKNFVAYNNFFSVTTSKVDGGTFGIDSFCSVMPINKFTKKYYYKNVDIQKDLKQNEIIIADYNYYDNINDIIDVGDTIDLQFVQTTREFARTTIKKEFIRGDFVVKAMNKQSGGGAIFVNEQIFNKFYEFAEPQLYSMFIVNSKYVTPRLLKNIRKFCYTQISDQIIEILKDETKFFDLSYSMIKFDSENEYNTNLLKIMNTYVAIPLFLLSLFVLFVLLSVVMADMVKAKGREILILKSNGANNTDISKIFILYALMLIIVQFLLGIAIGLSIMPLFNKFWGLASNYDIYYDTFYIGLDSALLMLSGIIFITSITLLYNMQKLNGKNLRKLFQKQRK